MSISYTPPPESGLKKKGVEKILENLQIRQGEQEDKTEAHKREIIILKEREIITRWIMVAVIIVLLVAFISMLLTVYSIIQDYIGTKTATTQELVNKIDEQNNKIDLLEQNYTNTTFDLTKIKTYFGIK